MAAAAITVLAFSVVAYFFITNRKSATTSPRLKSTQNNRNVSKKVAKRSIEVRNRWRATSIVPGENSCDAVKVIAGKRFLDVEKAVPKLPLQECDVALCSCKYAHHDDRRVTHDDRRTPNALHAQLYEQTGKANRRSRKRGRRKTDWA